MKSLLYFSLFVFVMTSCGDGNDATTDGNDSIPQPADSVADVPEEPDEDPESDFKFIEDYASITNKTAVIEQFGAENLKEDTAWYAEGTVMMPCLWLTDPESGITLRYVFEEGNPEEVSHVEAFYTNWLMDENGNAKQTVMSSTGLYTGMPLDELKEWNGADFTFSGFGWDYGGGIMAEQGSELATTHVNLTLDMEHSDDFDHLYGDIELSTADEKVQGAPVHIYQMSVYAKK